MLLIISPAARDDLTKIYSYTAKTWGNRQADSYFSEIENHFLNLKDNPKLGLSRPEIHLDYKSFPCEKHIIFYRVTSKAVEIIRVLHASMDIKRHLI